MKKLLKWTAAVVVAAVIVGCSAARTPREGDNNNDIPYWLTGYEAMYRESPREASKAWFRDARFGLMVHLNTGSLLERGKMDIGPWMDGTASDRSLEFVGYTREEYEAARTGGERGNLLFRKYHLANFDADKICALAVAAEMKYITFTTVHLGGCVNFRTKTTDKNSLNAPAGRDLVEELVKACRKHGLALFFYVTPGYVRTADEEEIRHNHAYLTELLTQYGPVAGIWFDGIGGFRREPEKYSRSLETYELVRKLQPHALISYKTGAFLEEDFISPENYLPPFEWEFDTPGRQERFDMKMKRWPGHAEGRGWEAGFKHKLREICTTMLKYHSREWTGYEDVKGGWINDELAEHLDGEGVYYWLRYTRHCGANLLMNIGPRGDGAIHPDDVKALTEVGAIIRERGWPPLSNYLE